MNANGELIGVAFDGNWEAMSGDIYFEPNIQRTIVCDIRYVLWIIDKCYGAQNLIDEMDIKKSATSGIETSEGSENGINESSSASNSGKKMSSLPCPITAAELGLKDVQFEVGQSTISNANTNLDKVVEIMKSNPKFILEIEGHADQTGDVCKNLILSEKRAKSVEKYVVNKGVSVSRIKVKGFGSAQPKDENKTKDGRAHNRRVSFMFK
jgi:outer membrane protein OmpA-like peptidoglycan-associated protein